jgi:hypothetical protein
LRTRPTYVELCTTHDFPLPDYGDRDVSSMQSRTTIAQDVPL